MLLRFLLILATCLVPGMLKAHEFDAERIQIYDAHADVLDGDTSTLFVQMTIANGGATTDLVGFETDRGTIADWIEIRRVFGREQVKVLTKKTLRTQTVYELQQPDGYLVIKDVNPSVYSADFGYIRVHALFEDGQGLDVFAWIDPVYVQIGN